MICTRLTSHIPLIFMVFYVWFYSNCELSVDNFMILSPSFSKNNYEVNKDAEKGKENTAFDHGESSKKTGGEQNGSSAPSAGTGNEKWVSNYVPFGDFPKGNNAQ